MTIDESARPDVIGADDRGRLAAIGRALIIVAHPDDLETHCGGTVARLSDAGCLIALVVCTAGEKGTSDRALDPARLAAQRRAEQLAASAILGIAETSFLNLPDGEISDDRQLRGALVREIRRFRPDLVITHDPEHPWPPYTAHRDHRVVGRATLDALYPDARDHLYFPEQLANEGLEPHQTPEAWLIMSQIPDLLIDIAAQFPRKLAARLAHRTQYRDEAALEMAYRERARTIGAPAGITLAEALKVVRFSAG